jgi:hypothetical protein
MGRRWVGYGRQGFRRGKPGPAGGGLACPGMAVAGVLQAALAHLANPRGQPVS